jgi:hypothetical protein
MSRTPPARSGVMFVERGGEMLIKTKPCPGCKRVRTLEVSEEDFERWRNGTLIQRAFPELTADEREGLITGYCGPCWDKLFKS